MRCADAVDSQDGTTVQDHHGARREYLLWHVHDAGGPTLRLKVRYRDDDEVQDWQDGPDLDDALSEAATEGWQAFDREPGSAVGEYAIYHLVRTV
jgi:hypothetical protein